MNSITVDGTAVFPTKIVCIGRNYLGHIKELNNTVPDAPVIFAKPNSAISDTLHAVHLEPLHYEAEISFLFEKGRFAAVGFGLDLTKRALQNKLKSQGLPWERCKAFNGSALFSPFARIAAVSPQLALSLSIDGKVVQSGHVGLMMHQPEAILAEIQGFMSLCDGDIVMTGTPEGVGVVTAGALFSGAITDGDNVLTKGQWRAV